MRKSQFLSKLRNIGKKKDMDSQPSCNICGNTTFAHGPGGRTSIDGKMPQCTHCHSLERHRSLRQFWLSFPPQFLNKLKVMQFSEDRAVDPGFFASVEVSIYEGHNSMDIQNLELPDGCCDIAIANHVLEHVPDDKKALQELKRIVRGGGFVQFCVPRPLQANVTRDWGYPKMEDHGHYRIYGKDVTSVLIEKVTTPECYRTILAADPVTGKDEPVFVIAHSKRHLDDILTK